MRLRAIAVNVLLAGSLGAPCQYTFLTNLDTLQGGLPGSGRSVKEVSDGYLVFGHQVSAEPLGRTHCVIYKVDLQGQFLWRKEYQLGSDYDYNFGVYDPVCALDTSGFASSVVRFNGADGNELQFYWFNDQGDTVRTHQALYFPLSDSALYDSKCTRITSDGGYICTGFYERIGNTLADAYLLKLNGDGDTLWTRRYNQPNEELLGYSVEECPGAGFVISGSRSNASNRSFIIRTDMQGNELWRRFFGAKGRPVALTRVLPSGEIITYCAYRDNAWPLDRSQFMLTKWSVDGDIVWQKKSHYAISSFNGDLEILPDGSIITTGETIGQTNLSKFSAEGDSLWSRNYWVTSTYQWSHDVEPTSDGGFVCTGYAEQIFGDPHPGLEVIWVLKTDSFGCVVPGCQNVGVQEYLLDLQERLHVSPNPASDAFTFSLALPEGAEVTGQVQAQLLDATGKLVLQQAVQQNLNVLSARMVVSALPAGIYYLHLRDAKRWLAGSKVVVQK